MLKKIKANFNYVLCAGMGLLSFILPAFNYVNVFAAYKGERETRALCTGYGLMDMEQYSESELSSLLTMSGTAQILLLILGAVLLAVGVLGLLKAFGVVKVLPERIYKFETKRLAGWVLLVYGGVNVLQLLNLILWTAANTDTSYGLTYGLTITFGALLPALLAATCAVMPILLSRYICGLNGTEEESPVVFCCEKCGRKAEKTDKFCSACGGSIVERGKAVEAPAAPAANACPTCGKVVAAGNKFCNNCGTPVAAPAAPAANVCPTCGKTVPEGNKFCIFCGTQM